MKKVYFIFLASIVFATVSPAQNSITLSSAAGTNFQRVCLTTAITNITYTTTGATGASVSGLPAGVSGVWGSNKVTISGTPSASGTFNCKVTLTGGSNTGSASGIITVSPTPNVTQPSNQTICNEFSSTIVNFTGSVAGTVYNWTNNTTSIGLAASGIGDIPNFTAKNITNAPVVNTITVTPITGSIGGFAYVPDNYNSNVSVINTATNTLTATIRVGYKPYGVSVSPEGSRVYVTNSGNDYVSVINTATNTVTALLLGGSFPRGVCVSPDGTKVYVVNSNDYGVFVYNANTNAFITSIKVGNTPTGITFSPDGTKAYVSNNSSNTVSVINTATNTVTATVTVGSAPIGLCISPDGTKVYVANNGTKNVSVINTTNNSVTTITVGTNPWGICVGPDGTKVYVTNNLSNTVSVINTATNVVSATLTVGSEPAGVCVSPDGTKVYVVNTYSRNIMVFNTATNALITTIVGGATSTNLALGNFIKANATSGCSGASKTFAYTVYPTPNVTATPSSQNICSGIAITTIVNSSPVAGAVYTWTRDDTISVTGIAASGTGNIIGTLTNTTNAPVTITFTIIPTANNCSGETITAMVTVYPTPNVTQPSNQAVCNNSPTAPINFTGGSVAGTNYNWTNNTASIGLAASGKGNIASFTATNATNAPVVATVTVTPFSSAGGGIAYIPNSSSNNVSVINTVTNTVIATIPVGSGPYGVSVTPDGTKVFVTNTNSNNVSVINTATNTVIATIPVGSEPYGVCVSPDGTKAYVTNASSNTVSVLNTTSNTVIATVEVGSSPFGVTVTPDGTKVYVVNSWSFSVSVINTATNSVIATVGVGNYPYCVSVTPDGTKVFVTNNTSDNVSVINTATNTVIATIPVGSGPFGVSVTPDGTKVFVANYYSDNVSVINTATNTEMETVSVGSSPAGISVTSDGTKAYVTNASSNTVSVISTTSNTVLVTVAVEGFVPYAVGNFITGSSAFCAGASKTFTYLVNPVNSITLSSTAGTNAQTKCINTAIATITYATTVATGATFSGLPAGISGAWAANVVTISGIPTEAGVAQTYTVTLTGGCGSITTTGTIRVLANNTIILSSAAGTNVQNICANTALASITYITTGATGATFSGLPTGVTGSWAANMVSISGTPTEAVVAQTYTIYLTGGCGSISTTGTIAVKLNTVTLSSAAGTNIQNLCANTALANITYISTGGTGATFSGLPTGITGSSAGNMVTVSGTPIVAGVAQTYTISITGGCGSISTTGTIAVKATSTSTTNTSICPSAFPYLWNGINRAAAGTYAYTTTNAQACDSVATLNLTVKASSTSITNTNICPSALPYSWNGLIFNVVGSLTAHLANSVGCDSSATLNLTVKLTSTSTTNTSICPSAFPYLWNGINRAAAGIYSYTTTNAQACDSIATLNLTVKASSTSTTNTSICSSALPYSWNGLIFNVAGSLTAHLANSVGCDSAATLNLTVKLTSTSTTNASICLSAFPYLWNGINRATAGIYSYTTTNAQACDSVATLNLTVKASSTSITNTSICSSALPYSWNGLTFTAAGSQTAHLTNSAGCDSASTLILTVNANNTITLLSAAGTDAQTTCNSTALTIITYTTSGATGATFSGLPMGVAGSWAANVVTISGTPNVSGVFNYTVTTTGGCPSGTTAATGSISIGTNSWIGGTGNWNLPANWSCGVVPLGTTDVTIATGTPNMNVDYTQFSGKTFTISGSGALVIAAGKTLTVTGTVDFAGNHVTIKSNATGTGAIGKITGILSGATNVTVERYIPNNGFRSWRLLSVPTIGQTFQQAWQEGNTPLQNNLPGFGTQITTTGTLVAAQAAGFDNTSQSGSLQSYSGSAFTGMPATEIAMATKEGYFLYIRGDRSQGITGTGSNATTLRTTGTLYQGNQVSSAIPANGYGLIGNLYPSAIDFTQLTLSNGVSNLFYVWDSKKLSGISLGTYQTFSSINNFLCLLPGGSYALGNPNTAIQSGQAFFVKANGNGGTVTLTENSKTSSSGSLGFRPSTPAGALVKLTTGLYSGGNNLTDANAVIFNNAYANAVDINDAPKMSNPGENLGIQRDGKTLAIEGRETISSSDTIQYNMWNLQKQTYQLSFVPQNLGNTGLTALLEDAYLKKSQVIDLTAGTDINFTIDGIAASAAANRFMLVFKQASVLPVSILSISANRSAAGVQVNWKVAAEQGIRTYEVQRSADGRSFVTAGTVAAVGNSAAVLSYYLLDVAAPTTTLFYKVKSIGMSGEIKYSSIIKLGIGKQEPSITASPNPVINGIINLQLKNQPKGRYIIRLLTNSGQNMYSKVITHSGGNSTALLYLPVAMARGNYQLEVTLPDHSQQVQTLFIHNNQ